MVRRCAQGDLRTCLHELMSALLRPSVGAAITAKTASQRNSRVNIIVQVSLQDASGKAALDLCTEGGQVYKLLHEHHTRLEAHAQQMAAELLEEEQATKAAVARAKATKAKKKKAGARRDAVAASSTSEQDGKEHASVEVGSLTLLMILSCARKL